MRISSNQIFSRAASEMMQIQVDIAKSQEQVSSGKRVSRPSDDPTIAGQLLGIEQATSQLEQFNRNADAAESRLILEETAVASAAETLARLRELALSSNNGAVDENTRSAVRAELSLMVNELYNTANSFDANGDYLFSGSNASVQPFQRQVPVTYAGTDDTNQIAVGLGRLISSSDSGADVFQRVRNGNGSFNTKLDPSNAGTGTITRGSVIDVTTYSNSNYDINFTSPTTFDITNTDTGATVQTAVAYQSGDAIEFDGLSINITGEITTGDRFNVTPSENQDIFSMVNDFVLAMNNAPVTPSQKSAQAQAVYDVTSNLDVAINHLNSVRSSVGARLNAIDSARNENEAVSLQLNRTLASIEDADLTKTVIDLKTNMNSLEVLQKSYARIESMSLFNFI